MQNSPNEEQTNETTYRPVFNSNDGSDTLSFSEVKRNVVKTMNTVT